MTEQEMRARLLYSQLGDRVNDMKGGLSTPLATAGDLWSNANAFNTNAALNMQRGLQGGLAQVGTKVGASPGAISNIARFAGSKPALTALRIGGPLAAVGGVMGAGDVLFGGDSAANKVMDGSLMTIGGILGSVGGPIGAAAGAGIGKTASDGLQWLFGDKMSPEERKLEEALALLKAGVV